MSRLSPTVRHRRLIHELRRLRNENRLTQEEVARQLDWSLSKQIKIERGTMNMRIADVRALLALYGANGKEREALIQLARDARQKSWWQSYGDAVPKRFETFLGLEAEAAAIHTYQIQLVPGLLQTVDYARAVMQAVRPMLDYEEIERQVTVRVERQTLLTREDRPLGLWTVLDEAVLHREVGNRGLMRMQLEHLVEIGRLPNVTIQVLPYAAGAHPSMGTSFEIVKLPEETDHDVVYLDDLTSSAYLEEPEDLQHYRLVFDHLKAAALVDRESAKLIARMAKDMKLSPRKERGMAALDLSRAGWRKSSRSNGTGGSCVEVALAWRKSSRSNGAGGNCVEVAAADRVIAVRDSKNPEGPKLAFPAPAWSSFTAAIKSGTHDL